MKVVTAEQMRAIEAEAHEAGMAYETMMDNAGRQLAATVEDLLSGEDLLPQCVLVLVGPGNNGGDGLVAARELARHGLKVQVYVWRRKKDCPLLQAAVDMGAALCQAADDEDLVHLSASVQSAGIVVDALLGTGAKGALRGTLSQLLACVSENLGSCHQAPARAYVASVNAGGAFTGPKVVAADLPSGMDADTGAIDSRALHAHVTVTFAAPKRGHLTLPGASYVGNLVVADIGIPSECVEGPVCIDADLVAQWLPERMSGSHKGTHGKTMVVAGSVNYVGAPALAAAAAYRAGVGLVTLGLPSAVYPLVASRLREATYLLLAGEMGALTPDGVAILADKLKDYDALLVGPGIGAAASTAEFVTKLLMPRRGPRHNLGYRAARGTVSRCVLPPTVIDADGLNHLSTMPDWWRDLPESCVLTPHPGEMARLTGLSTREVQQQRWELAEDMANKWQCVVVLKGAYTVIAAPRQPLLVSPFATSALAVAGTGDVLAGALAGLIAQGLEPRRAAAVAVYLHGLAGKMLEARIGAAGGMAGELLPLLPEAMRNTRKRAQRRIALCPNNNLRSVIC